MRVCIRDHGRHRTVKAHAVKCAAPLPAHDLETVPEGDCVIRGAGKMTPAWFDPTGTETIEVCPAVRDRVVQKLLTHDPIAGFLGIHPPDIDEVLCWVKCGDDGWRKRDLGATQAAMERVRAALLWGGLAVWRARCRAFGVYWKEANSSERVSAMAARGRKRKARISAPAPPRKRAAHPPSPDIGRAQRPRRSAAAMTVSYTYWATRIADEKEQEAMVGGNEAWDEAAARARRAPSWY